VDEIFESTGDGSWTPEEKARFELQKKRIFTSSSYKFMPKVLEEVAYG
jgi:hypothetical protein